MNARRTTLISLLLSSLCWAQQKSGLPDSDAKPNPVALIKAIEALPTPIEEPEFVWGRVTQWYRPCGDGVRPYLLWGHPYIGQLFRVIYHIYSMPREDGIYSTPGAWVVLSTMPPRNYEEPAVVFPNGCVLLWDIDSPYVFVWSFGGVLPYKDAVMERERNGRTAVLSVLLPNDLSIRGARVWTQLITLEQGADRPADVKTSQLIQITIGQPASASTNAPEHR